MSLAILSERKVMHFSDFCMLFLFLSSISLSLSLFILTAEIRVEGLSQSKHAAHLRGRQPALTSNIPCFNIALTRHAQHTHTHTHYTNTLSQYRNTNTITNQHKRRHTANTWKLTHARTRTHTHASVYIQICTYIKWKRLQQCRGIEYITLVNSASGRERHQRSEQNSSPAACLLAVTSVLRLKCRDYMC